MSSNDPDGFVSLLSLKKGPPDPQAALAEIRRIYFKTSKQTIDHDFAHAIELLKSLPEDERDKAAVFMDGLNQMRREWEPKKGKAGRAKGEGGKGKRRKADAGKAAAGTTVRKPGRPKKP